MAQFSDLLLAAKATTRLSHEGDQFKALQIASDLTEIFFAGSANIGSDNPSIWAICHKASYGNIKLGLHSAQALAATVEAMLSIRILGRGPVSRISRKALIGSAKAWGHHPAEAIGKASTKRLGYWAGGIRTIP
jgi:hypothetical protein